MMAVATQTIMNVYIMRMRKMMRMSQQMVMKWKEKRMMNH
jgi:hypothetical protein